MKKMFGSGLMLFLCLCWLALPAGAAPGPMAQAKQTVDAVMAILQTPDLDPQVRRQQLSTTIRGSFDFNSMAQRILAQNWRQASAEERERFTLLLAELLENSYIGNLENYSNEKVEFIRERIKKRVAAIDTLILTASKEIPVSYRMVQNGDRWQVYDVIVEKVSFVNTYRSSYGEIVKKEGVGGLLERMEEKLVDLRQASAQP